MMIFWTMCCAERPEALQIFCEHPLTPLTDDRKKKRRWWWYASEQ
jgi:hypothetical protein